jgi:hypothetical protein
MYSPASTDVSDNLPNVVDIVCDRRVCAGHDNGLERHLGGDRGHLEGS